MTYQALDIVPVWGRLNESLGQLIDHIPDDQMNWSPKKELWNFRGTILHIADARQNWLLHTVSMAGDRLDIWGTVRMKEQMKDALARTWARVEAFTSDRALLDATYDDPDGPVTGHWIAFHLLEHDIHHRADIFHYLALLGIQTPDVGTP